MKVRSLVLGILAGLMVAGVSAAGDEGVISVTTVYDNYSLHPDIEIDLGPLGVGGFACVIQTPQIDILFDTGPDGAALLSNLAVLNLDPADIDLVVISHIHYDHIGGLPAFLETNPDVEVFVPGSSLRFIQARRKTGVVDSIKLAENVYSTGELKSVGMSPTGGKMPNEQSLVLTTGHGLVVVTGCSHPGIVEIVKKSKLMFPDQEVHLVMGGFHTKELSEPEMRSILEEFRALGVLHVAPSHCSGDAFRTLSEREYGDGYIENGAGGVLRF
jgi:7,8-dihydropterin-6-yl-methyl-4-(beta-D-ribofuranosyl)aminobenzene 5'-phosphate synthase